MSDSNVIDGAGGATKPEVSEAEKLGYNPGWTDVTWTGADAPPLPDPTFLQRVRGVARMVLAAVALLITLPIFFAARALGGRRDRAVASWFSQVVVWTLGLRIRQIGRPLSSGGALLMNHSSWLDIIVIAARSPVYFVAKAEIEGWPLFGWIGKITNTVFIARRRTEAKAQEQLLVRRARDGDLLGLFPEGTSSDGLRVLPFKSSLFSMFFAGERDNDADAAGGALLAQPVSIHYAPRKGLPDTFYGWWGKMALFGHIFAVCRLGSGVVTVQFHEPMNPSDYADRKTLASEAENKVREGLEAAARGGGS